MRVMVLGSGGAIAQAIANRLVALRDVVVGVSRSKVAQPPGVGLVVGDCADTALMAPLLTSYRPDLVIDCTAYNLIGSAWLIEAVDARGIRYVMLSSSDVYANYGLLHQLETGDVTPDLLDEAAQLRASRFPYRGRGQPSEANSNVLDYYDKIPIEERVRQLQTDWLIVRLPMVFGPGDRQRRFRWIYAPMMTGAKVLAAPRSWLNWCGSYGYVHNIGSAIALLAHLSELRTVVNVCDNEPDDHFAWVRRFAQALGWHGEVEADDHPPAGAWAALQSLDLSVPLRLSTQTLNRLLRRSIAEIPLQQQVRETVAAVARLPGASRM